jgi:hypothetical protein
MGPMCGILCSISGKGNKDTNGKKETSEEKGRKKRRKPVRRKKERKNI